MIYHFIRGRTVLCAITFLLLSVLSFSWYLGLIPLFGGPERAGLRHALNLKVIPFQVSILASGSESWTDYIYEAEVAFDPRKLDKLLSGRKFKYSSMEGKPALVTSVRIKNFLGFYADREYYWRNTVADAQCTISVDTSGSRMLVSYSAD